MADNSASVPQKISAVLSAVVLIGTLSVGAVGSLIGGGWHQDIAQTVPMRTELLSLHHRIALSVGKESIGSVYITQERMFRQHLSYDTDAVTRSVNAVNAYAVRQNVPVYWVMVPTAAGIYADTLSEYAPRASEQAMLLAAAAQLNEYVTPIDVYHWLYAMRDAYIYYRTDERWTTFGAFCAYKTVIRKLGFANIGYDRFTIEHAVNEYYGSFAKETLYDGVKADVVDLYHCENETPITKLLAMDTNGNTTTPDSLYQRSLLSDPEMARTAAYELFLAETTPILQIKTAVNNTKELLVLTDSYGACMIPFLTQHYSGLTVVNLSLTHDMDWQAKIDHTHSQILVISSADTLADAEGFSALR
ncbi:MAG: hypothetical protein IKM30_02040 [Oscillospiraceae bacterium]|nr:hypothetical protein [Oscillospiraceae bacterium]